MNLRFLLLGVVITTMAPGVVGVDPFSYSAEPNLSDAAHLDEYSTSPHYQTYTHVIRRLESSSGFRRGGEMGDFLVLLAFFLLVIALAFPVNVISCCQSLQQRVLQCCCCVKPPRDTPPSEVDIVNDEPTSDYKLVTQISSTSMSTASNVDVDLVTDVA